MPAAGSFFLFVNGRLWLPQRMRMAFPPGEGNERVGGGIRSLHGVGLIRVLLRLAPLPGPCKLLLGVGCRRLSAYVGSSRFRQAALPLHYIAFASPIYGLGDIDLLVIMQAWRRGLCSIMLVLGIA